MGHTPDSQSWYQRGSSGRGSSGSKRWAEEEVGTQLFQKLSQLHQEAKSVPSNWAGVLKGGLQDTGGDSKRLPMLGHQPQPQPQPALCSQFSHRATEARAAQRCPAEENEAPSSGPWANTCEQPTGRRVPSLRQGMSHTTLLTRSPL